MRYTKTVGLTILAIIAVFLSACNIGQQPEPTPDVGAIFTAAAQTVSAEFSAQLTQTALAAPTNTPLPTATAIATFPVIGSPAPGQTPVDPLATQPTQQILPLLSPTSPVVAATQAGPLCNDYILAEETVPDGTVFKPGEDFVKTFTLKNTGTCKWDEGYSFVYLGGTLDGYTIQLRKSSDFVEPGKSILFKIDLTASLQEQTYTDCWRMQDDGGYFFGPYPVCVVIEVKK